MSSPASTGSTPIAASRQSGQPGAPKRFGWPKRAGSQRSWHTIRMLRLPHSMCAFMMPSMLTMPTPIPNRTAPGRLITRSATAVSAPGPGPLAPGSPDTTSATAT